MTPKRIRVIIEGRLPGLNELIGSQGRPWWMGRKVKEDAMHHVMWVMRAQGVPVFTRPVVVWFNWVERDKRRDRDNVTGGGSKIVFDAMKQLGLIKNDSRKWVKDSHHDTTQIDKARPRIEIRIEEEQDDG